MTNNELLVIKQEAARIHNEFTSALVYSHMMGCNIDNITNDNVRCTNLYSTINNVRMDDNGVLSIGGKSISAGWLNEIFGKLYHYSGRFRNIELNSIQPVRTVAVPDPDPSSGAFVTEWTMAGGEFELPIGSFTSLNGDVYDVPDADFDMRVYWGDGSYSDVKSATDNNRIHNYSAPGNYRISIVGKCGRWYHSGTSRYETTNQTWNKITRVIAWGNVGFDYLDSAFYQSWDLALIPSLPITGAHSVSNMNHFMYDCRSISSIHESVFSEMPNVTSFSGSLQGLYMLKYIPKDIFKNNTLVTDFSYVLASVSLRDASEPMVIDGDIFEHNVAAINFSHVLAGRGDYAAIPVSLFSKCADAENFEAAFETGHSGLIENYPAGLFSSNDKINNLAFAFKGNISMGGNAEALWNIFPFDIGSECFAFCYGLDNYVLIPGYWKDSD